MIHCRPFINSDPPLIAQIWNAQPMLRGRSQSVTPNLLERVVFSKPYFDPRGLILALDDQQPVGFVHAGFGTTPDGGAQSKDNGMTCILQVAPREDQLQIAAELLRQSEQYLLSEGAKTLYARVGELGCPFYLGLDGGSQLTGVSVGDVVSTETFRASTYVEIGQHIVFEKSLADFRPPVDRQQMQVRRRFDVQNQVDPPPANWWEACTFGQTDRIRCLVQTRDGENSCGQVTFWDMRLNNTGCGSASVGLVDLIIDEPFRRQGLATYVIGEAMKQLGAAGASLVEVQVPSDNVAALGLMKKIGFMEVDQTIVFRKSESPT